VLDGAVAVFDGKEGVEAQSETVWRQADRYDVPRMCFINKMDKLGADFEFSYNSIIKRLGANPIAVQYPMGHGNDLEGIIDLLTMKAYFFDTEDMGATVVEKDIPEQWAEKAAEWRHMCIEKAVELDEHLMERYLEDEDSITDDEIKRRAPQGHDRPRVPARLLRLGPEEHRRAAPDRRRHRLPAQPAGGPRGPGHQPQGRDREAHPPHDDTAPFSALVFKVVSDTHGDLTYARVYSGTLEKGSASSTPATASARSLRASSRCTPRTARRSTRSAPATSSRSSGSRTRSRATPSATPDDPIALERMTFPEPVISMSIEPKTADDKKKLTDALITIKREDPSFRSEFNEETGQTIIAGMGELHLEIIKNKITRDMKVNVEVGKPRVSYREAITGSCDGAAGSVKKQSGGRGQFGDCTIKLEPYTAEQAEADASSSTTTSRSRTPSSAARSPRSSSPRSRSASARPPSRASPRATPSSTSRRPSSTASTTTSTRARSPSSRRGVSPSTRPSSKAGSVLLEPVMKVVITTPEDYLGNVTGDLSSRRGMIMDTEDRGDGQDHPRRGAALRDVRLHHHPPGLSQGRAASAMEFEKYAPMPRNLQEEVIAAES
jgi:elongation factor G